MNKDQDRFNRDQKRFIKAWGESARTLSEFADQCAEEAAKIRVSLAPEAKKQR